jgi:hypothetical protein
MGQQFYIGFLYCSSWCQNMVPSQEPSKYNCFKWSLKGLLTRTGMTSSVFNAWITHLTSNTSITHFLNTTLGLPFQITTNQAPSAQLINHLLVWYLIISPIGSCTLDSVFWFNIPYDCSSIVLHDISANITVTSLHCLISQQIFHLCYQWCNWMTY